MPKFHRPSAQLMALAFVLGFALDASAQTVNLTFDAPVPGTLADAAGNGTGFTTRMPGFGSSLPANDPNLNLTNGTLSITSTFTSENLGTPPTFGLDINSIPSLAVVAPPASQSFSISVVIKAAPTFGAANHAGIIVGNSPTDFIELTLTEFNTIGISSPGWIAGWGNYTNNAYVNGHDILLTLTFQSQSWIGTWVDLTTSAQGTLGPQNPSYMPNGAQFFVGLFAISSGGSGVFTATFDDFSVSGLDTFPCTTNTAPLGPFGPNTVLWPESSGGNGHAYEVVSALCSGFTWTSAHGAAVSAGGYLATFATPAENAFVFGLVQPQHFAPNGSGPFIGGVQPSFAAEPGADWRWTSGEPWTWSNWAPGEPNNGGNEDRLQFANIASPGLWNDIPADAVARAYVVEYEPTLPCTAPVGSAFTLCAAHNPSGDARLQVFNVPADTLFGKTAISTTPATPVGTGSFFGLNADLFTLIVLLQPYGVGDPLSWTTGEPGIFPDGPHLFPAGLMLQFAGSTWDLVAVALTSTGGVHFSNFVQNTW